MRANDGSLTYSSSIRYALGGLLDVNALNAFGGRDYSRCAGALARRSAAARLSSGGLVQIGTPSRC